MPIYEYICNACGEHFSLLQKVGTTEKESRCTNCGSDNVSKQFSAFCSLSGGGTGIAPSTGFSGGG